MRKFWILQFKLSPNSEFNLSTSNKNKNHKSFWSSSSFYSILFTISSQKVMEIFCMARSSIKLLLIFHNQIIRIAEKMDRRDQSRWGCSECDNYSQTEEARSMWHDTSPPKPDTRPTTPRLGPGQILVVPSTNLLSIGHVSWTQTFKCEIIPQYWSQILGK